MTKKMLVSLLSMGILAISTLAYAGGNSSIQEKAAVPPMALEDFKELMQAFSGDPKVVVHVCILDNFGHVWELDVASPNITGTFYPECGTSPWKVIGSHQGLKFDMTAKFVDGSNCYCNRQHRWVGIVDRRSKTASGHAYAFDGCEADAPATGSKVSCPR